MPVPAPERMRLYRQRRRQGVRFVRIPLHVTNIEATSRPAARTAIVARVTSHFLNLDGLRIRILTLIHLCAFSIDRWWRRYGPPSI